jgi:GNAT superfamily N-acetyltransferase
MLIPFVFGLFVGHKCIGKESFSSSDFIFIYIMKNLDSAILNSAIFAFVGVVRSLILNLVGAALYLSQVCDKIVNVASKKEKNALKLQKHIEIREFIKKQASLLFHDEIITPSLLENENNIKSLSGRLDSLVSINIRIAEKKDTNLIFSFIKELARYEEMESTVTATFCILQENLFPADITTPSKAEVIILELDGIPIGMALYFNNFSTFTGKYGIYIEDLYVRKEFRGKGYGKGLIVNICQRALLKDCGRVEWSCLDWNKTAIDFYLSLGAEAMTGWTTYNLSESQIREIATPK